MAFMSAIFSWLRRESVLSFSPMPYRKATHSGRASTQMAASCQSRQNRTTSRATMERFSRMTSARRLLTAPSMRETSLEMRLISSPVRRSWKNVNGRVWMWAYMSFLSWRTSWTPMRFIV